MRLKVCSEHEINKHKVLAETLVPVDGQLTHAVQCNRNVLNLQNPREQLNNIK